MTGIVRDFAEHGYSERIQALSPDVCPITEVAERIDRWNQEGLTTVFMAGTFDIPTPNHRLGLAEARLMGAAEALGVTYPPSEELICDVRAIAASSLVKLVVTVDTNEGAAQAKGFNPMKGNCVRPIFDWQTRAQNVASYCVPRPDGSHHNSVDFITNHGPNACSACDDCASTDNALMVAEFQPSLVVVNAVSTATMESIVDQMALGHLPNTKLGVTNEGDNQVVDELLGGRISATAVVRRITGVTAEQLERSKV